MPSLMPHTCIPVALQRLEQQAGAPLNAQLGDDDVVGIPLEGSSGKQLRFNVLFKLLKKWKVSSTAG